MCAAQMPKCFGRARLSVGEAEKRPADRAIHTREFSAKDVAAVLAVARTSPQASQWSAESYEKILRDPAMVGFLAEAKCAVIGFLIGRLAADQAEILNLAVLPSHRRQGAASAMLSAALEWFLSQSATNAYLEVRESNTDAIRFYEKNGFQKAGLRRSYYQDPAEAAIVLSRELTG